MDGLFIILRTESNREYAAKALYGVTLDAKHPACMQIKPFEEKRTDMQNRFLFGWVYMNIAKQLDDAGIQIPLADGKFHPYTKDILHEVFGEKFLVISIIKARNGSELKLKKSTTMLSRKEFSEYVENCEAFARDFWGITVPPTTRYWEQYYKELMAA